LENVLWACLFVLVCIGFYRFGLPVLRRFDAANEARIAREARDSEDKNAHIRHALEVAEEQVEEVQAVKTGSVTHYLFEAEAFATREEAEEMRARRVGVIARRFYEELPAALMARGEGGARKPLSARERASARWKKTIH
jgi:undecaprenyl pyrophosphate synthase